MIIDIALFIFLASLFWGYFIGYFFISPFLLVKYKKKRYLEALVYECGLAEEHLKEISMKYGDKLAENTIKLITYSKYSILFSLVLLLIGVILNMNAN